MPLDSDEAVAPLMYSGVMAGTRDRGRCQRKEELILARTLENAFKAVPLEYRAGLHRRSIKNIQYPAG